MLGLLVGSCCWSQSTVARGAWSRHCPLRASASIPPPVKFVNPLEVDGFAEPGGWGTLDEELPLLYFFPGMDGSLSTPFMQYCELSTSFELACMCHAEPESMPIGGGDPPAHSCSATRRDRHRALPRPHRR